LRTAKVSRTADPGLALTYMGPPNVLKSAKLSSTFPQAFAMLKYKHIVLVLCLEPLQQHAQRSLVGKKSPAAQCPLQRPWPESSLRSSPQIGCQVNPKSGGQPGTPLQFRACTCHEGIFSYNLVLLATPLGIRTRVQKMSKCDVVGVAFWHHTVEFHK